MFSSLKEILDEINSTKANRISASRILMLPFFIAYHCWDCYDMAFAIAFYMVISDLFDGYIARLYKEESEFGKLLDPIADKTVTFGLFGTLLVSLYFLVYKTLWWSIIKTSLLLLSLEILLLAIGYWAAKKGVHGGSNLGGKAKMIVESYIFLYGYYFLFLWPSDLNEIGLSIYKMLWLANCLAIISIIWHLVDWRKNHKAYQLMSSR